MQNLPSKNLQYDQLHPKNQADIDVEDDESL